MRSRGRERAHGRAHPAAHAPAGDDRGDVVQPGDRRPRPRPPGARDRCPRWPHGPRDRSGGDSVSAPQSQQGAGGSWSARAGGSDAVSKGDRPAPRAAGRARHRGEPGRGSGAGPGRTDRRRRGRRWSQVARGRGGADHRHVPARRDPPRARALARGPRRRSGRGRAGAPAGGPGLRARSVEDRHAAAVGWPDHRVSRPGATAGRSGPRALLLSHERADQSAGRRARLPQPPRHRTS